MGHRAIAALAAAGMASALWVGAAAADPKRGDTFDLVCDNGHTYTLTTSTAHSDFTPAHVLNSTAIFVPVSFGEFTATITTPDGTVSTFTEPASFKGQSSNSVKNPVTCTYTFTFTNDGSDPRTPPGTVFAGTGSAVVKITPGH